MVIVPRCQSHSSRCHGQIPLGRAELSHGSTRSALRGRFFAPMQICSPDCVARVSLKGSRNHPAYVSGEPFRLKRGSASSLQCVSRSSQGPEQNNGKITGRRERTCAPGLGLPEAFSSKEASLLGRKGECPERQIGRTVNPLAKPS